MYNITIKKMIKNLRERVIKEFSWSKEREKLSKSSTYEWNFLKE